MPEGAPVGTFDALYALQTDLRMSYSVNLGGGQAMRNKDFAEDQHRKLVLIVDDDKAVRRAIQITLESEGFEAISVPSAKRGLEILADSKPDLIILDVRMPKMSGIGFLKQILGPDEKLQFPVLVYTAWPKMADFFENINVDGFVTKPCGGSKLLTEVYRIVSAHNPASEVAEVVQEQDSPKEKVELSDPQKTKKKKDDYFTSKRVTYVAGHAVVVSSQIY